MPFPSTDSVSKTRMFGSNQQSIHKFLTPAIVCVVKF